MRSTRFSALAVAIVMAAAPAAAGEGPAGHGHGDEYAYGEPGNPKGEARTITVTMDEKDNGRMVFKPSALTVHRGEQVRFVFRNHGNLDHEFVLGTPAEIEKHAEMMRKSPGMEHEDPNSERVKAGGKDELVWRFTKAGEFAFACPIPGHMESGMVGTITVREG